MVLKMPKNGVCNASLARNYVKVRITKYQFTSKDFNLEQNMTLGPPCKWISYSCRWPLRHKLENCRKNTTLALRLGPLHENSILSHYRRSISLYTPPYRSAWKMKNEFFKLKQKIRFSKAIQHSCDMNGHLPRGQQQSEKKTHVLGQYCNPLKRVQLVFQTYFWEANAVPSFISRSVIRYPKVFWQTCTSSLPSSADIHCNWESSKIISITTIQNQKCMGWRQRQRRGHKSAPFFPALFHCLSPALLAPTPPQFAGGGSACMCPHWCIQDHWVVVTTVHGGIKIREPRGSLHFNSPAVGNHSVLDVRDGLENPGVKRIALFHGGDVKALPPMH